MEATSLEEHLPLLDVLRGFALIGIFLANLVSFFGMYFLTSEEVHALPLFLSIPGLISTLTSILERHIRVDPERETLLFIAVSVL